MNTASQLFPNAFNPGDSAISHLGDGKYLRHFVSSTEASHRKCRGRLSDEVRLNHPSSRRAQLEAVLTDIFGPLSHAALDSLEQSVEWQHLKRGEVLFEQGMVGDALYIVISGRLRFTHCDDKGNAQTTGEIGRGEMVGELALITDEPRSATVCALRDTLVVHLSREAFDELRVRKPETMIGVTRHIVQSLLHTIRTPKPHATAVGTIALVPLSSENSLSRFAADLATNLNTLGSTLHLNSARFDHTFGRAGAAQTINTSLTNLSQCSWLSEQEQRHRFVLYQGDATWTPWTQRCLQQADRILLVGQSTADPTPTEIERRLRAIPSLPRVDLILLSSAEGIPPAATARWLAQREVQAHYHVRRGSRSDLGRLARCITGNALGLTLGGGAAHGLAHIGALRAFDEANLPVDVTVGVSTGALIGAAHALGMDHLEMTKLARDFCTHHRLFDFTLPSVALLSGRKMNQLLEVVFGDVNIEDMPRPFYCVSSNLTRGGQVVHRTGLLGHALRASSALPGLFAPVSTADGDVLVDGAVLNNVPVGITQELCQGGVVAAVDVVPTSALVDKYDYGSTFSGWRLLLNRFLPRSRRVCAPVLPQIICRTAHIATIHHGQQSRAKADLYIRPNLEAFGMFDFARHEQFIEQGYRAASEAIAAWRGSQPGSRRDDAH